MMKFKELMELAQKAEASKGMISTLRWKKFIKKKHEMLFDMNTRYGITDDYYRFLKALVETIQEDPNPPYNRYLVFFFHQNGSPLQNWVSENPERSREVMGCIHNNTLFTELDIRLDFWDASIFIR